MSPLVQTKRQIYLPGGGGGGTDITKDRIIREGLEAVPVPGDSASLFARILQDELAPSPIDSAIVAAALIANETPIAPVDSFWFRTGIQEVVPTQLDAALVRTAITEISPNPSESLSMAAGVTELPIVPSDTITVNVKSITSESAPLAVDSSIFRATVQEAGPTPVDLATSSVSGTRAANAAALSTGVTNPANALDLDADEATVTATSSGVGGTTSQTVNYDFQVNFADFLASFGWIDDITAVSVQARWRATGAGATPLGQSVSATLAYRLAATDGWTTISARSATFAALLQSADILALVGDDWTKLDALQMRASGSCVSGTGLGASMVLGIESFQVVFAGTRSI